MRRVTFFAIPTGPYLIFLRHIRIGNIVFMTKNYYELFSIQSKRFIPEFYNIQDDFFYIFTVYGMNSIKMLCI